MLGRHIAGRKGRMSRVPEEPAQAHVDQPFGAALGQQNAKLMGEASRASRAHLPGEAAEIAGNAPMAPDGQFRSFGEERFGATDVVEMAIDTRHYRIGADLPEGRERRLHLLDALPRVDDDHPLGTAHEGLVGQPVAHKAPGLGPYGVKLLRKACAMRQQPRVDLLASWSLHPPFRKHRLQHARLPNFCCYAPRLAEGTGIGPGPKSVGHGIMTPIANDFALLGNCPCLRPYFDPSSPSPAFASLPGPRRLSRGSASPAAPTTP